MYVPELAFLGCIVEDAGGMGLDLLKGLSGFRAEPRQTSIFTQTAPLTENRRSSCSDALLCAALNHAGQRLFCLQ